MIDFANRFTIWLSAFQTSLFKITLFSIIKTVDYYSCKSLDFDHIV